MHIEKLTVKNTTIKSLRIPGHISDTLNIVKKETNLSFSEIFRISFETAIEKGIFETPIER